jgi:hypothetical protein
VGWKAIFTLKAQQSTAALNKRLITSIRFKDFRLSLLTKINIAPKPPYFSAF